MKLNDKKLKEAIARIKKSLQKQIQISSKHGFDVKQHWKEMLNSLEKEKVEINLTNGINLDKKSLFRGNPHLQKPKTDYGDLVVKALRRANFDQDK